MIKSERTLYYYYTKVSIQKRKYANSAVHMFNKKFYIIVPLQRHSHLHIKFRDCECE
jgi:hypothetical protein